MLRNFGVFSFLRSWKLTRFLTTCISATSFKIWTFSAFLYISETTRTNFFKSLHIIFMINIMRFETFIEIDSLQHLKISSKPILRTCQKSALQHLLFSRYANFSKIIHTIHTSMTSTFYFEFIVSFECKTLQYSHWNVLVMEVCLVRIIWKQLAPNFNKFLVLGFQ